MEAIEILKARRSCHEFKPGFQLPKQDFEAIIEVARHSPSGYNAQPWEFLLVQDSNAIEALHTIAYKQDHILDAGNVIIVLGNIEFGIQEADRIVQEWVAFRDFSNAKADGLRSSLTKDREAWKKREMCLRNVSLAAMNIMNAAELLGLSTCPMMGFKQLELKRHLNLPEHIMPIMMIAIGRRDETQSIPPQLPRKSIEDLTHYESYGSN